MSASASGSSASASGSSASRRARGLLGEAGILIPFVITLVVLGVISPPFLRTTNLANILDQQSGIIIVAAAGTLVLIAGGIDLSVGAVYGLAGAFATQLVPTLGVPLAIAVGLGTGTLVGITNGMLVTRFRINALIATLAMTYVVSGIGALVTRGNLVVVFDHPEYQQFSSTRALGLTSAAWIMILWTIVIGLLLARTTFGRYVYSTGGNAEAARLAGVRTDVIKIAVFALSGAAAALAGILDASRVMSAQSSGGGAFLTFTVLAGIVVGGTSIQGGEGAVWRTVIGCLFIALIGNGFNLLGLDPFYQQVTLGLILLLAVGVDSWSRRSRR